MPWTNMKVLRHDGSQHHGVGIQPTVPVTRSIQAIVEDRDEALEVALRCCGLSRPLQNITLICF